MEAHSARLVLVDDDRLILATLASGLRNAGYQVSEGASGKEALRLCAEIKPDLAILDIRMPDMSGIEIARRLKAETDTPFVFLSAYSDTETVGQAIEEGALGYLVKPVYVSQMVPAIEAALVRAAEIRTLKQTETHLNIALASGRETSIAIGVLMERYRLTSDEAFDALRSFARSERRKVREIAADVIHAAETMNVLGAIKPQDKRGGGTRG
jgi:two-component system, response regulator PdtaR